MAARGTDSALALLASESALLLAERDWRRRRVDSVTVTETLNTRTRTSIDFVIPSGAPEYRPDDRRRGEVPVYYLPVALLAKWPPLANFDLTDESGRSLALLTKRKNREVDVAALCSLVPESDEPLRNEIVAALSGVVESEPLQAPNRLRRTIKLFERVSPDYGRTDTNENFMWSLVRGWASVLTENSLLWVPVSGWPGDRRIVKFAFEQPLDPALHFWKRVEQSLSFGPAYSSLTMPQISAYRSYHLQFEAPRDLQVVSVRPELGSAFADPGTVHTDEATPRLSKSLPRLYTRFSHWFERLLRKAGSEFGVIVGRYLAEALERRDRPARMRRSQHEPARGELYRMVSRRRVHLYVSEPFATKPVGGVQIALRAGREGVITGSFIAGVLIAIVMSVYAIAASAGSTITEHLPAAVTVLVLVPGLIGYLAVRPDEHPLLRRHVRGVRLLLLLAASVPMAAAVMLITVRAGIALQLAWIVLALISWSLAGLLAVSWLLPGLRPNELD